MKLTEEEIFYLHDHVVLKSNGKIGIIIKFINDIWKIAYWIIY